jgi:hypothetical protein
LISSQILLPNPAIGSTALSVILDDFNAAITAIHNIPSQNNCKSIVQNDHSNHKNASLAASASLEEKDQDHVYDMSHNLIVFHLFDIIEFGLFASFHLLYFENQVHATNKNTSQNAKAQATYTGTNAKFTNSFMLNFFSIQLQPPSFHFLKKYKSQNIGENIA